MKGSWKGDHSRFTRDLCAAFALICLNFGTLHAAPTAEQSATAQVLYDQGKQLLADKKYDQACPKLEESNALDAQPTTLFYLATCQEAIGKTASAWFNYSQAADLSVGEPKKEEFARKKARDLEPKLSHLSIVAQAGVPGLKIRRGTVDVGQAQLGVAIPVDPGEIEITAGAPGKITWTSKVTVGPNADQVTVQVPALQDAPAPNAQTNPNVPLRGADSPKSGSDARTWGFVLGGVGIAGLAAGGVFLVVANHNASVATQDGCNPTTKLCPTQDGIDAHNAANTNNTLGAVFLIAGGALLITGVVLGFAAPNKESKPSNVSLSIGPAGFSLSGRF